MVRNIILSFSLIVQFGLVSLIAQDADPIEAARQAKLAAEKAAADAEAATGAAIEAAAAKAAAAAREKVIADRKAEEARKIAEKEAAENAEIDAAAEAAALEARRKLAAELGLELEEVPDSSVTAEITLASVEADSVLTKSSPLSGFNFGLAPSFGIISGETFTAIPLGATAVITTPYGFKVGPFQYTVSLAAGMYLGEFEGASFDPVILGLGGNLTLLEFIFAEGHVGVVGDGMGIRGFGGVSLERLMNKGLNLPFNVLVGSEIFISNDMAGVGNSSGWLSIGARLDYNF